MADASADGFEWDRVISFVNSAFGDDINNLQKAHGIYTNLSTTKESLEKQLSLATTEAPSNIQRAVVEAELSEKHIEHLVENNELLRGDLDNHAADVSSMAKSLSALTSQMQQVERYANYLKVISRIEDFSADVQSALLVSSVERAVAQFFELAELVETLQTSRCKHLVTFANDTVTFWYNILKGKFASEFDEVLRAWQWPFVLATTKVAPIQNAAELRDRFGPLFINLLHLQLPDGLSHLHQQSSEFLPTWRPILLPIQLMIRALSKRFRFHFYGSKQTNSLDKPEWYMSQILTWIRDHREFLRTRVQPLLEREGLAYVDAVVEFSRGLVVLVMEKLQNDIPELLFDDHTFSHMVDEVLMFDRELRESYGYPSSQPGCLHILTQEEPFHKWIRIEKKFAQEKLDDIFSSVTAWQSQYKDIADVDDVKVPECGESFITLMLTITERYKPLPLPEHRLEFLDLVLDLLEDYRYRLTQIKTDASQDPLGQCYTAILNTVNYVTDILRESSELVFFVQLHYYKKAQNQSMTPGDEAGLNIGYKSSHSLVSEENTLHLSGLVPSHSAISLDDASEETLAAVQGSVFDDIIDLFDRMRNEMIQSIVLYVTDDVKARTRPYRNDKWAGMPVPKDVASPALLSSACEMMLVLRERLQQVEQLLNKPLFTAVWQKVANLLNTYLYQELILANKFNEGGTHQVQFDMTRNLFPLFGQYTQKPESYFKDLKEACHILTMPVGSALLLKDTLYRSLHDPTSDPYDLPADPVAVLHEQEVYKLGAEEVELILRLRTDLAT